MLVLDRAHFDHMTAGDRALQAEVIGLFRGQTDDWRQALQSGEGWRDAVHKLKGSARGIGLAALADACEVAEAGDDAETRARLDGVRGALEQALAELTSLDLG